MYRQCYCPCCLCVNTLELSSHSTRLSFHSYGVVSARVTISSLRRENQQVSSPQTSREVSVTVSKMYHSQICITSSMMQRIPLNKLSEDQILNFSLNPWDHLSPSEDWICSESEEENNSDKFSVQSPVTPSSLRSSNSNLTCNECDSVELHNDEL